MAKRDKQIKQLEVKKRLEKLHDKFLRFIVTWATGLAIDAQIELQVGALEDDDRCGPPSTTDTTKNTTSSQPTAAICYTSDDTSMIFYSSGSGRTQLTGRRSITTSALGF